MERGACIIGFLLLAAAAFGVEEPEAGPLQNTKQELKALQRDQATKKSEAATGKLLGDGLKIESPTASAVPFDFSREQKKELSGDQRNARNKNWLLDEMSRLEKDAKGKGRPQGKGDKQSDDDSDAAPASSDPDYILKVYEDRKKEDAAKQSDKTSATRPGANPMAPFLQGWLSPTSREDRFMNEFAGRKGETSMATLPGGDQGSYGLGAGPVATSGTHPAISTNRPDSSPNPYLQNLETPSANNPTVQPATTDLFNLPAVGNGTPSRQGPAIEPATGNIGPEKKSLTPPPADDKKYFPQLKKF